MLRGASARASTGKLTRLTFLVPFLSHGRLKFATINSKLCIQILCRNSSKKALTNDLIDGLEKDLDRLKMTEENLRLRKLRTMKGGDKIINETE